jgi:hypothetical protein
MDLGDADDAALSQGRQKPPKRALASRIIELEPEAWLDRRHRQIDDLF